MLIDQLRELLKSANQDLELINDFWRRSGNATVFESLEARVNSPDFWQDAARDQLMAKHHGLKEQVQSHDRLNKQAQDFAELLELFADNEKELEQLQGELYPFCSAVRRFKLELLLSEEDDAKNCYISINSGAGGTESQDWADILLRMYVRFCEQEGFAIDVLDYQEGEGAGIKSCTLFVKGKHAFGFLKAENGIHRLVRISPFDANKRRHTSFAGVTIIPEAKDEKIQISETDLRIDTYRAGGAGGQHVNKTESAVRITHIPTGVVVQCQNERSQGQNKQTAMKLLKSRLVQRQEEERRAKEDSVKKQKIEWGSQIRSYVLHPYKMVKDHRTDYESFQPDQVLDGQLMPLIEAYLLMLAQHTHGQTTSS